MTALPAAIVDSHHHLWDLSRIDYPWLGEQYDASAFILGEYYALCRDFLPRDFREAWGGMPVVASVHIEAECARSQALAETRWLHEQAAESGLPSAVAASSMLTSAPSLPFAYSSPFCTGSMPDRYNSPPTCGAM